MRCLLCNRVLRRVRKTKVCSMYAGECRNLDLSSLESFDNIVYTSVGNQSNLEGLSIILNGTNVDVCSVTNYKPDNFTLIFWDDTVETTEIVIYRGGGGGSIRYVDRNITEYIINNTIKYIEVNDSVDSEEQIFFIEGGNEMKQEVFKGIVALIMVAAGIIVAYYFYRKEKKWRKRLQLNKDKPKDI